MTHEEFISIVRKPELVTSNHESELKGLVDLYPYFAPPRMFYLKALRNSNSIQFSTNLKVTSLYCSSRRWLYYYLYPDKLIISEPYKRSQLSKTKSAGDYFDMIDNVELEGGDTKQSLKKNFEAPEVSNVIILKDEKKEVDLKQNINEVSEDIAKKLISERKYSEAIEILRALNLNNPKKSVYFADQIRFLEKIITNSKK